MGEYRDPYLDTSTYYYDKYGKIIYNNYYRNWYDDFKWSYSYESELRQIMISCMNLIFSDDVRSGDPDLVSALRSFNDTLKKV